jgi:alpha-mannosidase
VSVGIVSVTSTERFVGTQEAPRQVLHVTVERGMPDGAVELVVSGPGVAGSLTLPAGDGPVRGEVPLDVAGDPAPGATIAVRVTVTDRSGVAVSAPGDVVVAEPGWTMVMVSHFHYDPVWWNTQASYTSDWELLGSDWTTRPSFLHNAFALVEAHLKLAVRDPDYHVVLAELDYLKPYFDTFPEQRAVLRRLMDEGRVEMVGGTYNEPNTNLTGSETTIRNIVYGLGYQRDILGGDPRTAWQLDVFGHDPQFPGLVAKAGMTGSAWARGPHHQWGPLRQHWDQERVGQIGVMQFESEFEWISPSGDGVLTHYMPDHYGPGWEMQVAPTVEAAADIASDLFDVLKPAASTRNVLLPVGGDYCPPNNWVTEVHRWWNTAYVWPRFVCGTTKMFLDRVRAELEEAGRSPSPQTRDMNPVYTGKDVSYIDTKQGQRAAEIAAVDAERLSTFAGLLGEGRYPEAALDKVWRQLAYGAHHDAITGSESDQVYIDLLTGWREAHDLAVAARDAAAAALVTRIDTTGDGSALVVVNTLAFERTDMVRVELGPTADVRVVDDTGTEVPAILDAPGVVRFVAHGVPSMGWRSYRLVEGEGLDGWSVMSDGDPTIENDVFAVTADPERGGTLVSVRDKRRDAELLTGPANELRVYEEYDQHPTFGEGPWHLLPNGRVVGAAGSLAEVAVQESAIGRRIVARGEVDGLSYEQVVSLFHGLDRVELITRILDHEQADRLVRVRFPVDQPGALPVSEVAGAVIGRGFGLIEADTATAPWTLDNPANTWFGIGTTARVDLVDGSGSCVGARPMAVAEVVVADGAEPSSARDLVVALARVGVTATTSRASGARYGGLDTDSNLPDIRILVAEREHIGHALVDELVRRVGPLPAEGCVFVPAAQPLAKVWQPNADVRDLDALPTLVVRDVAAVVQQLPDFRVRAVVAGDRDVEPHRDGTVALLTYGLPGFAVDPEGGLNLSLMRSCTGWPSGVWIDPPRRTAPDGSAFQLQHWTHEFHYALVSSAGDWREAALPARGQEFSTALLPVPAESSRGDLPAAHSLLTVEPARDVLVATLKAAGNPVARGASRPGDPNVAATLRLVESTGRGCTAQVTLSTTPAASAFRADLLEVAGEELAVIDGGFAVGLAGSAIETVVLSLAAPELAGSTDVVLGLDREVAQPTFGRYWLHNRGPAPMGYLPVGASLTPVLARCAAGSRFEVVLVVTNQYVDSPVPVSAALVLPAGWAASTPSFAATLAPLGYARFRSWVDVPPDAQAGQYFVAAQVTPDALALAGGAAVAVVEDVSTVFVGDSSAVTDSIAFDLPSAKDLRRNVQRGAADTDRARPTGLDVHVSSTSLDLVPGTATPLTVTLRNRTLSQIRGEIQIASPWGTWEWVADAIRAVVVGPGATTDVELVVRPPADALPGHSWLMPKVMWFGRAQYAGTVRLEVTR